jgi:hypothetical protein
MIFISSACKQDQRFDYEDGSKFGASIGEKSPKSNSDSATPSRQGVPLGPLDLYRIRIFGWETPHGFGQDLPPEFPISELVNLSEQIQRESVLQEEFLSVCMHEKGFWYLPRVWSLEVAQRPFGTFTPQGSREWAQRFGFGHSTQNIPGRWSTEFETLVSWENSLEFNSYMEQMSAAETHAFWMALMGVFNVDWEGDRLEWTFPATREEARAQGCQMLWRFEEEQRRIPDRFAGIRHEMIDEFPRIVEADTRILDLNASWATCMAEAGYTGLFNPTLTSQSLEQEFWDAQTPVDAAGVAAELAELEQWDWDTYPEGPPRFNQVEFMERERAIAVASWDCRENLSFDVRRRVIELDLQQQFVDKHWLVLEDWVRAVESTVAP